VALAVCLLFDRRSERGVVAAVMDVLPPRARLDRGEPVDIATGEISPLAEPP
jgi:hypothetical protein